MKRKERRNKNQLVQTHQKRYQYQDFRKKETPEGLWTKCPECNYICTVSELRDHLFVCPKCGYHHRIGSSEYYDILFDDRQFTELFEKYPQRRLPGIY